ncbi:cyclase family protein [Desulfovermiculus halophilus]|jgi:kynurenine formamidase|uniref:cyclase family protein n=1 Tax=Desulfovermiculus halophilus TaxID=339722 RepID=UPI000483AB38|nr:cyclase family protein [Desulfovermiculus halophilus]
MGGWIDLTHPLYQGMPVWPGDTTVGITEVMTVETDGCSAQRVDMGNHVGTHVDAPSHFVPKARDVDQLSLQAMTGPARLLSLPREQGGVISRDDLQAALRPGDVSRRIILRTGWGDRFATPEFYHRFPVLTVEAAEYLAGLDLWLLGMDTPSPSPIDDPGQRIHKALLGAGVVLVESMAHLDSLPAGEIDVCVLPLPLHQASGAPCRAIGRCCGY